MGISEVLIILLTIAAVIAIPALPIAIAVCSTESTSRDNSVTYPWHLGHQNRLRPSTLRTAIGSPHTKQGSPARR